MSWTGATEIPFDTLRACVETRGLPIVVLQSSESVGTHMWSDAHPRAMMRLCMLRGEHRRLRLDACDDDDAFAMCLMGGMRLSTLGPRTLCVWDLTQHNCVVSHAQGGEGWTSLCRWRKDYLIVGHSRGLYVLDAVRNVIKMHLRTDWLPIQSLTSDGQLVLCGSHDGEILVWKPECRSSLRLRTGDCIVWDVAILGRPPDDTHGATRFASCGDSTRCVQLWEAFLTSRQTRVRSVGYLKPPFGRSHDVSGIRRIGEHGVVAFTSREIRVWNTSTRRLVWRTSAKRCRNPWDRKAVSISDVCCTGEVLHAFAVSHSGVRTTWIRKTIADHNRNHGSENECGSER